MVGKHNHLEDEYAEDEAYCREHLGIKNAKGLLARRLRELSAPSGQEDFRSCPLQRGRFLVVDLETTGMKSDRSEIIEVGAVEVDGFRLGRELSSLVNPGTPVPPFIRRLTGIHDRMLRSAPSLEEVLPSLEGMLRDRVLVAHNLKFDQAFLKKAWREVWDLPLDGPSLCSLLLARRVYPELNSHKLDSLAAHLNIRPEPGGSKARHRALGDARMTAKALVSMLQNLTGKGMDNMEELLSLQSSRPKKKKVPLPQPGEESISEAGSS
ncbi:MAG: 3'-5' exonuclease [bacterium]